GRGPRHRRDHTAPCQARAAHSCRDARLLVLGRGGAGARFARRLLRRTPAQGYGRGARVGVRVRSMRKLLLGLLLLAVVAVGAGGALVYGGVTNPVPVAGAADGAHPAQGTDIAGPSVVEPANEKLRDALDRAFAEPPGGPPRGTKAVVVLHDGRVVAERYAPGYGIDTPLLGWSMTKSVVNALVGILVRQGRLSVAGPAPVPAWRDP